MTAPMFTAPVMEATCIACGQGPWKATNPAVGGFITGCLCSDTTKLRAFVEGMKSLLDGAQVREGHMTVKVAAVNHLMNRLGVRNAPVFPELPVRDVPVDEVK